MLYTEIGGKKISKMTLGTVQLGMNYGIANENGQPKEEQSMEMLGAALESGVNSLDTARAYGNSEDVLGHFLAGVENKPFITTKVPMIEEGTDAEVEKFIVESAEASLQPP